MINFIKTVSGLMPPDTENPDQMRLYHRHNSIALTCVVLFVFIIVLPAMFYALPKIGSLAWASDIDAKVEQQVSAKLAPLNTKVAELNDKVATQGSILREIATASLRSDICRYVQRRAKESDPGERLRLLEQIETMKRKYLSYAAEQFNTSDC